MAAEQLLSTMKGVTPVTGTPQKPLPRDAFIDPRTGAERPINNPLTNPNYQKDLENSLKNAEINKQFVAVAESKTLSPEQKQVQMDTLRAQKTAMEGITPEMRTQYTAEMNLPQNLYTPPVVRDMEKEQSTIDRLGGAPTNEREFQQTLLATYGKSGLEQMGATVGAGGVIQAFDPAKLKAAGFSDAQIASLSQAGQAANVAQMELNATPKPTNAMLGVLQSALKAASGVGKQEIGTSKVFEAAGIPTTGALGYGALAASMQQRRAEMGQTYDSYANTLQTVGGQMSDLYSNTLEAYNSTMQRYDKQVASLEKLNAEERDYKRQLDLMKVKSKQEREDLAFAEELKMKYAPPVFNPATGEQMFYDPSLGWRTGSNGKPITTQSDASNSSTYNVSTDALGKIFGVGGLGDWCGVFAGKISTAENVGDTWAEKRTHIDKQASPNPGDKLLLPIGVRTDKGNMPGDWGHVATVIDYNAQTGEIKVVESNKDGRQTESNKGPKGIVTIGSYNINDLKRSYGSNWGFVNGDLRPQYKSALEQYKSMEGTSSRLTEADLIKKAQAAGMDVNNPKERANILSNYKNYGVIPGGGGSESSLAGLDVYETALRNAMQGKSPKTIEAEVKRMSDLVSSGKLNEATSVLKTAMLNTLGDTGSKTFTGLENTLKNLGTIEAKIKNLETGKKTTGFGTKGVQQGLSYVGQDDPALRDFQKFVDGIIQGYRKDMSGTAFTTAEKLEYESLFPSLDKTIEQNKNDLATLNARLSADLDSRISSASGGAFRSLREFTSLAGSGQTPSAVGGWLDQLIGKIQTKPVSTTGNLDKYLNSLK